MKRLLWPLAVLIVPAILGAAGLFLIHKAPSAPVAAQGTTATLRPADSHSPAPTASATPSAGKRATHTARQARHRPHHIAPWAVISAYYRSIDSRMYAKAWALISPALAARQTYQQFVAGYGCTGNERPARLSRSGHQVTFTLVVINNCAGTPEYYTGTDTVRGGKIVAADVTRTG